MATVIQISNANTDVRKPVPRKSVPNITVRKNGKHMTISKLNYTILIYTTSLGKA